MNQGRVYPPPFLVLSCKRSLLENMISKATPGRLSARWKVLPSNHLLKYLPTFVMCLFIGLLSAGMVACQDKNSVQEKNSQTGQLKTDSASKPKVDIKVNRHYDDKGNMIGFDSTYSRYYSSVDGDTSQMDSMFKEFNTYFNKQHQALFNNRFDNLFFNDSLMYPDFFHDDFFTQRYRLNDHYFRDMMSKMDSVKNNFYREHQHKKTKPN